METFINPKKPVENPSFQNERKKILGNLTDGMIDPPIVNIVKGFNRLPYCFTLQSCYGHFLYNGLRDAHNLAPLPITESINSVEYRIAYIAFCVENSQSGKHLLEALEGIPDIDPKNIQFCCADWFWKRQVNSYALQVEPDRFKHKDSAIIDYHEALHIEKIRNLFFTRLRELLQTYQ